MRSIKNLTQDEAVKIIRHIHQADKDSLLGGGAGEGLMWSNGIVCATARRGDDAWEVDVYSNALPLSYEDYLPREFRA